MDEDADDNSNRAQRQYIETVCLRNESHVLLVENDKDATRRVGTGVGGWKMRLITISLGTLAIETSQGILAVALQSAETRSVVLAAADRLYDHQETPEHISYPPLLELSHNSSLVNIYLLMVIYASSNTGHIRQQRFTNR